MHQVQCADCTCQRIVGIKLNGAVKTHERLFVTLVAHQEIAFIVPAHIIIRGKFEGMVKAGKRLTALLHLTEDASLEIPCVNQPWIDCQRPIDSQQRFIIAFQLEEAIATGAISLRVVCVEGEGMICRYQRFLRAVEAK